MFNISVDEERTTFLATLAKIEEAVDALIEERNYLVRRDERKGVPITDERSVRKFENENDTLRTNRRIKKNQMEERRKIEEARLKYAEKQMKPRAVNPGKQLQLRSDKPEMQNREVVVRYMSPRTKDEKMYLTPELFDGLQDAKTKVEMDNIDADIVANAGTNQKTEEMKA